MERFKLLTRILIALVILVAPVLFTTATSEYFEFPKTSLIYGLFSLGLVLIALKVVISKKFEVTRTYFDFPLMLVFTSMLISSFFGTNTIQALINGLAPLGIAILLYFVVCNVFDPADNENFAVITRVFILGTVILGVLAFLNYFNVKIFPFDFTRNRGFSPIGNTTALMTLFGLSTPLAIGSLLKEGLSKKSIWYLLNIANLVVFGLLVVLQTSVFGLLLSLPTLAMIVTAEKESISKLKSALLFTALALAAVFVLFYVPLSFNKRFVDFRRGFVSPITLDNQSSWIISVQTVRDYPFFGSGPASFLSDFVRYRPFSINTTPYWTQRFSQAAAEPYQVLATLGIAGLLVFLFFIAKLLKFAITLLNSKEGRNDGIAFSTVAFIIALLFSVPSTTVRAIFFILLALYTLRSSLYSKREYSSVLPAIPATILVVVSLALGYLNFRNLAAEVSFKSAIDAVAMNNSQGAINGLSSAINNNPYRDNYHLSSASLLYTMANGLASKPNLTDQDRELLIQLINNSINEAKAAVTLDPFNGTNLETLASIYRNIAGAVQNAASWSVTAYQQAIQIEPANPNLRFQLGSLFYAAQNYELAGNYFSDAIRLKSDVVNYHYNLAWALAQRGLFSSAIDEMTTTARMVDENSEDGKRAKSDIEYFTQVASNAAAANKASTTQPSKEGQLEVSSPKSPLSQPNAQKVSLPSEASPSSVKVK